MWYIFQILVQMAPMQNEVKVRWVLLQITIQIQIQFITIQLYQQQDGRKFQKLAIQNVHKYTMVDLNPPKATISIVSRWTPNISYAGDPKPSNTAGQPPFPIPYINQNRTDFVYFYQLSSTYRSGNRTHSLETPNLEQQQNKHMCTGSSSSNYTKDLSSKSRLMEGSPSILGIWEFLEVLTYAFHTEHHSF